MADMRTIAPIVPAGSFAVTKSQYIEDSNGVRLDAVINGIKEQIEHLDIDAYTKSESDEKFENKGTSYSKAESDEKYAESFDVYTKNEANEMFVEKGQVYTKTESDNNYETKGYAYSKNESNEKYATKGESYTKSEVNERLANKVDSEAGFGLISETDKAKIPEIDANVSKLQSEVTRKAENSDINAVNARIDNLIINAGGDNPNEVTDAHTGADGAPYLTLKSRLDSEYMSTKSEITHMLDQIPTKNLFNKETITDNIFINGSGEVESSTAYFTSDYIKCPTTKMTISSTKTTQTQYAYRVAVYDSQKRWLRRALGQSDEYVLDGVNGYFIRISFEKSRGTDLNSVQVESGDIATPYVPHRMPYDYNARIELKNHLEAINELKNKNDEQDEDTAAFRNNLELWLDPMPTKNLFDKSACTDGVVIDESGNEIESNLYFTSDYIYCSDVNVTISATSAGGTAYAYRVAIYDSEKEWLRRSLNVDDIATINGVKGYYIRVSFEKSRNFDIDTIQVELGSVATPYVPHRMPYDFNTRQRITYISPEMFGALGNGDVETDKLQAMFDWIAENADKYPISVCGKTGAEYKCGTININTPTYNLQHNISIENMKFVFTTNLSFAGESNNHYGFHFVNCNFSGHDSLYSVLFNNYLFTYSSFEKCSFQNYKHIIYADVFEQLMTFEKCHFEGIPYCFYGTAFYTLSVRECTFKDCARVLMQDMINDKVQPYYRIAQKLFFENNYFSGYTDYAFRLYCYSSVDIVRNYFEHGINSRHGILLQDSELYSRGKYNINILYNHMQDTIDTQYSPRMLEMQNATVTNVSMIGNVSFNTRFLNITNATVKGIIRYENNTHINDAATVQDVLGNVSAVNFNGDINGELYIKGRKVTISEDGFIKVV